MLSFCDSDIMAKTEASPFHCNLSMGSQFNDSAKFRWFTKRNTLLRQKNDEPLAKKYGKLNTSRRAIYSTKRHIVEHFGPQMPRAVIESLTASSDAKINSSVNVNAECGWGWYVCGRKLLVWPVLPSSEKIPPTVIARELQLPSSDLAHNANLVAVYVQPGNKVASCMAVTPEGLVRCWPTIGQYSFDVNTHLGGEEVCAVRYIPPLGCLAITTSASMILLTPSVVKGMPTVTVNQVSVPQGWISGISRRVSSIIFGVPPAQGLESRIVKVLTKQKTDQSWHVFLLSGLTLQSWNINKYKPHEMFFECDLTRMIEAEFQETPNDESEIFIQDMRYSEMGLLFLVVSSRPRSYMIVEVAVHQENLPPCECTRLCTFTQKDILTVEGRSGKIANLQFLPLTDSALVFNNKIILGIQMTDGEQHDADKLDVPGGLVLGGHMYNKVPLFFSATYGFVSVSPTDTSCMDVINSSTNTGNGPALVKSFFETQEGSSGKVDYVTSLKSAFIYFVRKSFDQYKAVIKRDFPSPGNSPVDSPLSTTLINVSLDIINDVSSNDPRWDVNKKQNSALPRILSLKLETQLVEKQQAHDLFLQFVQDLAKTADLGKVTRPLYSSPVTTLSVLYEHNEKITAAIALRKLQNDYPETIKMLINLTCEEQEFVLPPELGNQDLFYKNVSLVDDGIRLLCRKCEELLTVPLQLVNSFDKIQETNNILIEVFRAVIHRREEKSMQDPDPAHLSWISASGPVGLFDSILKMNDVTLTIITDFHSHSGAGFFRNQLLYLCDVILYSRKNYPELGNFSHHRSVLIRQFLQIKELEKAVMLAEKFKDFNVLTEVCVEIKNEARLIRYFERFGKEGFCEAVFEWYLREKKIAQLLDLPLPVEHYSKLTKFLEKYPNVAWLHTVRSNSFTKTYELLSKTGLKTFRPALRKERMLALSKLATCASYEPIELNQEVSNQLHILRVQRKLPSEVLDIYCYEKSSVKAFSIEELIMLFTCENYKNAKIEDFCTALGLLKYLNEDKAVELRNMIWVKAIKRNFWVLEDLTAPLEIISNFFVFQLLNMSSSDPELEKAIPKIEDIINHEELQELTDSVSFRYLLSYTYEVLGLTSIEAVDNQTNQTSEPVLNAPSHFF